MHTTHHSRRLVAGLLAAATVIAACGGDDDDTAAEPAPAEDEMSDDEMSDDEMSDDEMSDDEMSDDEMSDDEMSDEEMSDEEMSDDEMSDEEMSDDAAADVSGSVKVGLISTLSGGAAYLGEGIAEGFELAFELDGRFDLELIVEDDGQDPDQGQSLARRMLERDEVDVMTGIVFSNVAAAVVPLVVAEDTLYLSANAGPSPFAGSQCNENYFVVSWQNDNPAEAMGRYLADQGVENVVGLAPNYQAGIDQLNGFERTFGEFDEEIFTELGATDYAQAIAQIRDADPDAAYFFYPGGMGIAFIQQYQDSGLDIPIYGPTFSFDENLVDAIGPAAVGLQNAGWWVPDNGVPASEAFVEAYRAKFDRTPTQYAAQGWDTANLLISALEATGGDASDTAALREAVEAANFDSVRGDFAFNSNHHPIQDWYLLEVAEDAENGDLTNVIVDTIFEGHEDAYVSECSLG